MRRTLAVLVLSLAAAVGAWRTAEADSPDSWITAKAKIALLTADDVSGTSIDVDTVDGKVTLHGKVSTAAEKARAEQIARKIDGVKGVQNLIQVVPSARKDAVKASDSEIEGRVEKALDADASLKHVDVASVNDGVVLLKGEVPDVGTQLRAIETASGVAGVRRVASEIEPADEKGKGRAARAVERTEHAAERAGDKVEHEAKHATKAAGKADRPDGWVTMKTKLALLTSDEVSGGGIDVDTRDGRVTLHGHVPSAAEKVRAEEVARRVDGVHDVKNLIQVVPASRKEEVKASDREVEDDVEKALSADASLKGIKVGSVNDGVVVLEGKAQTLARTLRAVETASKVRGVRRVASEIEVEK